MEFKELQELIDNHTFMVFDKGTKEILHEYIKISDDVDELIINLIFELSHRENVYREEVRERAYIAFAIAELMYDMVDILKAHVSSSRGKIGLLILSDAMLRTPHSPSALNWIHHLVDNHESTPKDKIDQAIERIMFYDGHIRSKSLLNKLAEIVPGIEFE